MDSETILETNNLTVYYGLQRGIKDLNLSIRRGEIFGFLGPNGAGKTTTLRVLLDIIHPTRGRAAVFGLDSQKNGVAIRKRLSYLPGELSLDPSMKADYFLDLIGSLQGNKPDRSFLSQLLERLDFDPSRKIKEYSHGNKQKIGIIAAFMGKQDLIILDEPTIALDPLVQQTVLELVKEVKDEGRTVFFSSHNLKEVQTICDRVGIIQDGELIKTERIETLIKQQLKHLNLIFRETPLPDAFAIEGVKELVRNKNLIMFEIRQNLDLLMKKATPYGITDIESKAVSLEEIFLSFYKCDSKGDNDD